MIVTAIELFDIFGVPGDGVNGEGVTSLFVKPFRFRTKHFEVLGIGDVVDCYGHLGPNIWSLNVYEPLFANL